VFRRLDRYVLRTFIGPFVLTSVFAVGIYAIIETAENLEDILQDYSGFTELVAFLIRYHLYRLPILMPRLAYAITMIAVAIALVRLARHNELLAMKALGLNLQRVVLPLVVASFVIALSLAVLQEAMLPHVAGKIRDTDVKGGNDDDPHVYRNVMVRDSRGNVLVAKIYHAKRREFTDAEWMEANREKNQHVVTRVKSGRYDRYNKVWLMTGTRQFRLERGLKNVSFTNEVWETDLRPRNFTEKRVIFELVTTGKLFEMAREVPGLERKLWVLIHSRFAFPFAIVALVLVGLPFVVRDDVHGAMLGVGVAVLICVLFYGIQIMLIDLGERSPLGLPPWLPGWGSTGLFAALGIYQFRRIGK